MDPITPIFELINPFTYLNDTRGYQSLSLIVYILWSIIFYTFLAYLVGYYLFRRWKNNLHQKAFVPIPEGPHKIRPEDAVDVAIVGSGPAGGTAGYFLARDGYKVKTFDSKQFPRDKPCGDAVCKIAIEILAEMQLFPKIVDDNLARVADNGGVCSPLGNQYVGSSHKVLGEIPAALAIRRTELDKAIAYRARDIGVDLVENAPVSDAKFDKENGLWSIYVGEEIVCKSRVLVCADGSTSYLAKKLGLHDAKPTGIGTSQFIKGGTHENTTDGIVYYSQKFLPNYAAIFTHPDPTGKSTDPLQGDLMLTTYILPGNPNVKQGDIGKMHKHFLNEHPQCSAAIGGNPELEKLRSAPLRLEPIEKPYGEHVLVIGDAAGFIDPLTGEGIHHAMESGKIAAELLLDCLRKGNFSEEAMSLYKKRTYAIFEYDFYWSNKFAQLMYRYPVLLEAGVLALQRGGEEMLARWADIMTGRVPKLALLTPQFVIPISFELVVLLAKKAFGKIKGNKQQLSHHLPVNVEKSQ